jgi:sRNA-binding regulator protein Hfq
MMENVENTQKEEKQKHDRMPARYNTPYGYGVLDNFGAQLVGKLLTFELMNNKTVTGKLKGYGQFDIMVTDSRTGQDYIIMKHAIVSVQGDLTVKQNSETGRKI